LGIYSSDDLVNWKRQEKNILEESGTGGDDQVIGGHPDVVVNGERAFVFYFTHRAALMRIRELTTMLPGAVLSRWLNYNMLTDRLYATGIARYISS